MPGNGNHDNQRGGNPLGNKVKEELLSALRLLFKSVETHDENLSFQPDTTFYVTTIPADVMPVDLQAPHAIVSDDPIGLFREQAFQSQHLALLKTAELAPNAPCHMEPALCSEPVFDEMDFEAIGISFENMVVGSPYYWPITPFATQPKEQPIQKLDKPASKALPVELDNTKSHSALEQLSSVKARQHPRFLALPICKVSIPSHRFTLAQRERFRQALAEKAGTHPANIQLKVVFGRMHMPLYASIQPDDQGNLLCIPKGELLGKNMEMPSSKALLTASSRDITYLVIGVRLDTKADIRALVPMSTIQSPSPEPGGQPEP